MDSISSAYLGLQLIVLKYFRHQNPYGVQDIDLNANVSDLGITRRDLIILGRYLSGIYNANVDISDNNCLVTIGDVVESAFSKIEKTEV